MPFFKVRAMTASCYGVFILNNEVIGSADLNDREYRNILAL